MGLSRGGRFLMDIEKFARQVRGGPNGKALDELARSGGGEKLLAGVDGEKLAAAAKAGDMQTLGWMLQDILATPEGRELARKVQKAVQGDGR